MNGNYVLLLAPRNGVILGTGRTEAEAIEDPADHVHYVDEAGRWHPCTREWIEHQLATGVLALDDELRTRHQHGAVHRPHAEG